MLETKMFSNEIRLFKSRISFKRTLRGNVSAKIHYVVWYPN